MVLNEHRGRLSGRSSVSLMILDELLDPLEGHVCSKLAV